MTSAQLHSKQEKKRSHFHRCSRPSSATSDPTYYTPILTETEKALIKNLSATLGFNIKIIQHTHLFSPRLTYKDRHLFAPFSFREAVSFLLSVG